MATIFRMDVKNAFLHGDLKEEVYIGLQLGLTSSPKNIVGILRRSLYGLEQVPKVWFENFWKTLVLTDFLQSQYDLSLFFRKTSHGITILLVYIDDIIITGDDPNIILQLQKSLHASFHMKDLGPLTYFLGLVVHKIQGRSFMNQNK